MRKIKETLRLRFVRGIGQREIARSCQIARSTVRDYLRRAQLTGLTRDSAAGLNKAEVQARLYPDRRPPVATRPLPDCEYIYNQLRSHRKMNLTLTQLSGWNTVSGIMTGTSTPSSANTTSRWRGKLDYGMRHLC